LTLDGPVATVTCLVMQELTGVDGPEEHGTARIGRLTPCVWPTQNVLILSDERLELRDIGAAKRAVQLAQLYQPERADLLHAILVFRPQDHSILDQAKLPWNKRLKPTCLAQTLRTLEHENPLG